MTQDGHAACVSRPGIRKWCATAAALLVLIASIQIVLACNAFSQTYDEPNHLAAGMEWLQAGSYGLWPENPPVARIAVAALSYLSGVRLDVEAISSELPQNPSLARSLGNDLLYGGGLDQYPQRLLRARLATLLFFIASCGAVWVWASRDGGPLAGLLSTAVFCSLPPILAHSGLATTDVAAAASLFIAIFLFTRWVQSPLGARALLTGVAAGIAVTTKFSALLMLSASALTILVGCRILRSKLGAAPLPRSTTWSRHVAIAAGAGLSVVWFVYRFDVGPMSEHPFASLLEIPGSLSGITLPAPALFIGLFQLFVHNQMGHSAYALGAVSQSGFWFYYPLVLLVKTPLPTLLLGLLATVSLVRSACLTRRWESLSPIMAIVAILIAVGASNINIGVRHVLIVYPLLAVSIGVGAARLLSDTAGSRRQGWSIAIGATLVAQLATSVGAHPNYLSFFNTLAGPDPGRVLVDSDLDWGQDLANLEGYFAERDVAALHLAYFGTGSPCRHNLPDLLPLDPMEPSTGWIAISESFFRGAYMPTSQDPCDPSLKKPEPGSYSWLRTHDPVHMVGRSIRVYHLE